MMMMCYMIVTSDMYDMTNYDHGGRNSAITLSVHRAGADDVQNAIATCIKDLALGRPNHAAALKVA